MNPFEDIILWRNHLNIEIDKESPKKEPILVHHEGASWPEFLPNTATADDEKSPESKCT